LLRVFAGLVPSGWTVIVMTDRAMYARWLYQEIVSLGWHPVIPITHQSKFRKGRSKKSVPVTALVPRGVGGRAAAWRFPQEARAAVGVHAAGLLGRGLRGAVVPGNRPGAGPGGPAPRPRRSQRPTPGPSSRDAGRTRAASRAFSRQRAKATPRDQRPRPLWRGRRRRAAVRDTAWEGSWRLLMEVSFADCLTAGSVPACAG
jgi:hypothetical protein